ncbi:putative bifunctional diguanylate cyclase/phosphodiesterase [Azospirillum sp. ST 5-10]|uniref:putative bifunctional diguanylate cyclase/phosphodiesterase n=1 Tax=unclassified Azospirillum TaxID=2630922 RepID=UPI003F4A14A7
MSTSRAAEIEKRQEPSAAPFPRGVRFLASLAECVLDEGAFAVVYTGPDLRCRHVDARFAALLRLDPAAVPGHPVDALLREAAPAVAGAFLRAAETGRAQPVDGTLGGSLGGSLDGAAGEAGRGPVRLTGTVVPHRGAGGAVAGFLGILRDVGGGRTAGLDTRRDPVVAALLDAAVDGIIITDGRGVIRSVNRACCTLFGFDESELLDRNVAVLMPSPFARDHDRYIDVYRETDRAKIIGIGRDTLGRRKDGTVFPIHLSVGEAKVGAEAAFVGIIRDISDRLAAEQRASYLARHDPLTGVLTRAAFLEECEAVLGAAADGGACYALYALDVDQFSDINEAFGFHVGDAALKTLVGRMAEVLPGDSLVGRVAADEFAALARLPQADAGRTLAEALHDRLTASIFADRHWVRLRVSVGAAVLDRPAEGLEELSARAKLALQSAQHGGGNAVCLYTPEMAAAAARRALLTVHLAHAIERGELHLLFQPIVAGASGRIVSAEALLRWTHPTLGGVSPGEFIPVAEESGLIVPITDWVLTTAVDQMAAWLAEGAMPERVFVNISGQQFLRGNLTHRLAELLEEHPALHGRLGLEITEQAAVHDVKAAVRILDELASVGVQVAIDDFGSGYSSLSYVQQLPVTKLKIDRSFIIGLPHDAKNAALVRAAIGMAHGLGLATVAEGVELDEQREFLRGIGCDMLQGYLFGRPMPADALADLVRGQDAPA